MAAGAALTGARGHTALVVPALEAEHFLRPWRTTYTADGRAGMWAHVTLLYPFLEPAEVAGEVDRLRAHFERAERFRFSFRETRRFPAGVLYLAPEPEERFRALAAAVHALYPDRPPYEGAFADVVPHCTVVDLDRQDVLDAAELAVRAHLPLDGVVLEAWLVELAAEGWSVRARLPFAG